MPSDEDQPHTGLRALINGQSHARRDAQFFRTGEVDKEHLAGSLLVTLDCSALSQQSRNNLFMSNRESFRESEILSDLLKKVKRELRTHEGLKALNEARYEQKVASAVNNEEGVQALEDLLQTDPTLAGLFGGLVSGRTAGPTEIGPPGGDTEGEVSPFKGFEVPTFFKRKRDGATSLELDVPQGATRTASFTTDVQNNYFSRRKNRGTCVLTGSLHPVPTHRLFNGRLTFSVSPPRTAALGSIYDCVATITDRSGSGPFVVSLKATVVAPIAEKTRDPKDEDEDETDEEDNDQPDKIQAAPSRPNVKEVKKGLAGLPLTVEKDPKTQTYELHVNVESQLLQDARKLKPKTESAAVDFVFKYGLALAAMGLMDSMRQREEWKTKEAECRSTIADMCTGVARVIVPLCLSLSSKLPKPKR